MSIETIESEGIIRGVTYNVPLYSTSRYFTEMCFSLPIRWRFSDMPIIQKYFIPVAPVMFRSVIVLGSEKKSPWQERWSQL